MQDKRSEGSLFIFSLIRQSFPCLLFPVNRRPAVLFVPELEVVFILLYTTLYCDNSQSSVLGFSQVILVSLCSS